MPRRLFGREECPDAVPTEFITPYLADRSSIAEAAGLLDAYGPAAGLKAAARARASRHIGNHIHFCRWRQIERLIALMSIEEAVGTIH